MNSPRRVLRPRKLTFFRSGGCGSGAYFFRREATSAVEATPIVVPPHTKLVVSGITVPNLPYIGVVECRINGGLVLAIGMNGSAAPVVQDFRGLVL